MKVVRAPLEQQLPVLYLALQDFMVVEVQLPVVNVPPVNIQRIHIQADVLCVHRDNMLL